MADLEKIRVIAERIAASEGLTLIDVELKGQGKSRLLRECVSLLPPRDDRGKRQVTCLPHYIDSPYFPLIHFLRGEAEKVVRWKGRILPPEEVCPKGESRAKAYSHQEIASP